MFRAVPLPFIRSLFTVHSALVCVIQVCRQLSSRTRMVRTTCGVAGRAVKTELERTWKEVVVAYCHYGACLEELRRTTKTVVRIACTRAETWIPEHLLRQYCLPILARLQALTADDPCDCSPAIGHATPWSKDVSETCCVSIITADVVRRNPSSLCMYMAYPVVCT